MASTSKHDIETDLLEEIQSNDGLEAQNLRRGFVSIKVVFGLHTHIELDNGEDSNGQCNIANDHDPDVSKGGAERRLAVATGTPCDEFNSLDDDGSHEIKVECDPFALVPAKTTPRDNLSRLVLLELGESAASDDRMFKLVKVEFPVSCIRFCEFDKEEEESCKTNWLVETISSSKVDGVGVAVDGGAGEDAVDNGKEGDADDLSLLAWSCPAEYMASDQKSGESNGYDGDSSTDVEQ